MDYPSGKFDCSVSRFDFIVRTSGATKGGLEGAQAPPSPSWGRPAIPPDPMTFCTGWGGTYAYCLSMLAAACLSSYRQARVLQYSGIKRISYRIMIAYSAPQTP